MPLFFLPECRLSSQLSSIFGVFYVFNVRVDVKVKKKKKRPKRKIKVSTHLAAVPLRAVCMAKATVVFLVVY